MSRYVQSWYPYLTPNELKKVAKADAAKVAWEELNRERTRLMRIAIARKRRLEAKTKGST